MTVSLNKTYQILGVTRQSFHEWLDRQSRHCEMEAQLVMLVRKIRVDHPRMSARKMYRYINPKGVGRDKFIQLCMDNGLAVEVKRNPRKTTDSSGVKRFPNLVLDLEVVRSHQVWVSDITYFEIASRFYYLTFIMDLYSRFIVGYSVAKDLRTTSTTLPALKRAISAYSPESGTILHSDGGGQYYAKAFIKATEQFRNSMTQDVAQNNHAERLNGTIKNDYLSCYMPTTFKDLQSQSKRAVWHYNYTRPHQSLNYQTPAQVLHGNDIIKTTFINLDNQLTNPVYLSSKTVRVI